jgi:hypothetical protein
MPPLPLGYQEIKENYKKYLAIIILLFIYLMLPVLSISLVYLIIYTTYRWITLTRPILLVELYLNIFFSIVFILIAYVLRRLIIWLRE